MEQNQPTCSVDEHECAARRRDQIEKIEETGWWENDK